jgi:hypothetical protein
MEWVKWMKEKEMKNFRLALLICFVLLSFTQLEAQEWSDTIFLAPGTNPDLCVDPVTGDLHLVTIVDNKGVLYVKADKRGNVIDSLIVPGTEKEEGMLRFGPTVAVDSKGMPHVGFRDYRQNNKYDVLYTYMQKRETNSWSTPKEIASRVYRGYCVRIAVDSDDFVHFAHGFIDDTENNLGHVNYYILKDGEIIFEQDDIIRIRGDERLEIDISPDNILDLVTGDLGYPEKGGPVYYWRSKAPRDSLTYRGDLHAIAKQGENGSPDLFVDALGNTHVCYGSHRETQRKYEPSVRYHRIENGITVADVRVTDEYELADPEYGEMPVGIGSVAANDNGDLVVIAYTTKFDGPLYARLSEDGGNSWGDPQFLADGWDDAIARNKHIVRAFRGDFSAVFPTNDGVALRYLDLTPNDPPVAQLVEPDTSEEGVAVNFDASGSYDPDGVITAYQWDFENDGIVDDTTDVPLNAFVYQDDFSGQAKVTVFDVENEADTATVPVVVMNVPPEADAGGPYSGDWYVPIDLFGNASDPGVFDSLEYSWDVDNDGIFESYGQNVQTMAYASGDSHLVIMQVMDKDGGVDTDTALVLINNQPPVISDIFDQIINEKENFSPIYLDAFVADPDNPDSTLIWAVSGMLDLIVDIDTSRVATVTPAFPEWTGSESIVFMVTDPGGETDSDTVLFSINDVNEAPVAAQLPPQTRLENETFSNVLLDDFVADPDHPDSAMTWTYYDAEFFAIDIMDNIATFAVIDSEWAGTDSIAFIVADPEGLKDTTSVSLTVLPLNDWPEVTQIEDQEIFQNEEFAPIYLDEYVFDPDDADSVITWSWIGNSKLVFDLIPGRILMISHPDSSWTGSETVIFRALDRNGLRDECITTFIVNTGIGVEEAGHELLPDRFALHQNYPNPFNPRTLIRYDISRTSHVVMKIYNQLGHEVRTLVNHSHAAGSYQIMWNATNDAGNRVSSGMYFYRLETSDYVRTRKMVLLY